MVDIVQLNSKREVLNLEPVIRKYACILNKEAYSDDLFISIFTKVEDADTLLLVPIKNDEPVGFLWAQSFSSFGEDYLVISEIYSREAMMGTELFKSACIWASEHGFCSVKGMVRAEKAKGLKRLFKMHEESVLISLEV